MTPEKNLAGGYGGRSKVFDLEGTGIAASD
jgi:hypothetical protein